MILPYSFIKAAQPMVGRLVSLLVFGLGVIHLTPIQIASLQTHDEHFRTAQVGCNGHIVLITVADGFQHLVVVPGIGIVGIGKEQNQIDLIIRNAGIDLLMTSLLMGKQQRNGQTGIVSN